ncbi:MAG: cysteine--tRNA ligase, partial [Rhizobiales bacterium]|nr:cysteine--tRNA ligase [Hyphomicrobiales bacterium]
NTPLAIARLHALRKAKDGEALVASMGMLGIGRLVETTADIGIDATRVAALIAARAAARKAKDFAEADRIRGELDAMGIALKDAKDPPTGELVTTWEVKR